MAEPPRRRQRPDSSKMWEESENRGPASDRDDKNDRDRRDDRNRTYDRNRRDRSRSPRDSRDHKRSSYRDRDRERDRGGRRDDRDARGSDRNRDSRYRDDGRSSRKESHRTDVPTRTRGEFMPNALSQTVFAFRSRPNIGQDDSRQSREKDDDRNSRKGMFSPDSQQDGTLVLAIRTLSNTHQDNERSSGEKSNERARSRSPRRDDEGDYKKDRSSDEARSSEYTDEAPQPVSFSIGASHTATGQDHNHDRMDIDSGNKKKKSQPKKKIEEEEEEEDDIVIEDDGMAAMQAMMGFGGFGTTQNKKVPGNNVSAVRKEKRTEYRQYMNRVGGFNRPLSPSRD